MRIKSLLVLAVLLSLLSSCDNLYQTSFKAKVVNDGVEYLTPDRESELKSEIEKVLMYEVLGAYRDAVFLSQCNRETGMDKEFYRHLYLSKERIKKGGPSDKSLERISKEDVIRMIKSGKSDKAAEVFYSKINRLNVDFGNSKFSTKGSVYVHDIIVKWWCDFDGSILYLYGTSVSYPPTVETFKKGVRIENVLEKEIDSDYRKYCRMTKIDSIKPEKKIQKEVIEKKWRRAKTYHNKFKRK